MVTQLGASRCIGPVDNSSTFDIYALGQQMIPRSLFNVPFLPQQVFTAASELCSGMALRHGCKHCNAVDDRHYKNKKSHLFRNGFCFLMQ